MGLRLRLRGGNLIPGRRQLWDPPVAEWARGEGPSHQGGAEAEEAESQGSGSRPSRWQLIGSAEDSAAPGPALGHTHTVFKASRVPQKAEKGLEGPPTPPKAAETGPEQQPWVQDAGVAPPWSSEDGPPTKQGHRGPPPPRREEAP